MSKSKKVSTSAVVSTVTDAAPAMLTVAQAIAAHCNAGLAEIRTTKDAIAAAHNAVTAANRDRLTVMRGIWQNVPGMTGDRFDTECRQAMFDTYKASYAMFDLNESKALAVIKNRLSVEKVAIIALSAGSHLGKDLTPLAGETLTPYVKRVNILIQAKADNVPALYVPKSGARPKPAETSPQERDAKKAEKAKAAPNRQSALSLLCKADAADMQMLDMLTANNMVQLRGLYAMLYPVKTA